MKQCDFSFFLPFFFIYCISILYGLLVLLFVFPLIDRGYNHNYVKRNYVYRLNVTFGDTSFDGDHEKDPNIPIPPRPTTGDLDVQVEVVNWGQVSQDVEI